jgi:molybdopterin-guanine dinucleotide biosynthesis protein A
MIKKINRLCQDKAMAELQGTNFMDITVAELSQDQTMKYYLFNNKLQHHQPELAEVSINNHPK